MIVTMKTSVAIECGEGEQYFVLRMECCWILYLSCHSQPSSLEMNQTFCPAPNKCRRGLQRGICAESFLRRVSVFRQYHGSDLPATGTGNSRAVCTTVNLQKDSRDKPTRCNQLIGGWLNLACFVSIDILVTCQLPNLSAKRGSHGQVGMDILDIFNAFMLPSSNLEGRCSHIPLSILPMTEESAWSEATSATVTAWNDVVGDEVFEPFEWWQVELF